MKKAIVTGIKRNVNHMIRIPGNIAGYKGIAYTGRQIKKWPAKLGRHKAGLYLAQLVRMQEEIGTGGGGFRYIYAAFLQEAAAKLNNPMLKDAATKLTDAGDEWRRFALKATKMARGRSKMDTAELEAQLNHIADREQAVWGMLKEIQPA